MWTPRDARYDESALVSTGTGRIRAAAYCDRTKTAGCLYADLHGSSRGFEAARHAEA